MTRKIVFWVGMVILFIVGCLVITWLLSLVLEPGVTPTGTSIRMLAGAVWGVLMFLIGFLAWDRWVA